jgi:uncharacterized protein YjbI with pentapeptide repeats
MTDAHHAKLRQGALAWNIWRDEHLDDIPQLEGIQLTAAEKQWGPFHGGPINLSRARLKQTNLDNALMTNANLAGAQLTGASLVRARLDGANLSGSDLTGANLDQADLTDADLFEAVLSGAKLAGARNLTQDQIDNARGDASTELPPGLVRPTHWLTGEYAGAASRPAPWMAHPADLYALLGVARDASDDEIRDAYYARAKSFHPDQGGSATDRFKQITQAARILRDPEKRVLYDRGDIDAQGYITAEGKGRKRRLQTWGAVAYGLIGAALLAAGVAGWWLAHTTGDTRTNIASVAPQPHLAKVQDQAPAPIPPQTPSSLDAQSIDEPLPVRLPGDMDSVETRTSASAENPPHEADITGSLPSAAPQDARVETGRPLETAYTAPISFADAYFYGMSLRRTDAKVTRLDAGNAMPPPPERRALAMPAVPSAASGASQSLVRGIAGMSRTAAMSAPMAAERSMTDAQPMPPARASAASRFPAAQLEEWPRRCVLTPECQANLAWCSC